MLNLYRYCSILFSMMYYFSDAPKIQEATASTDKSWIGQTVKLNCVSDGIPTPTLTWYKPDGSQIKRVTASQNTVDVEMNEEQDFGDYKCTAENGFTPAGYKIVKIQQISKCCLQ